MEITIRPWRISDLENLVKYGNNKNIADNMTDGFPYPYTNEAGIAFIERISLDQPLKVLAITFKEKLVSG